MTPQLKHKKKRKKDTTNSYGLNGGMLSAIFILSLMFLFSASVHAATVTLNQGQYYDIDTGDIGTVNASMDFLCARGNGVGFSCNSHVQNDMALISTVNHARVVGNATQTSNAVGLLWSNSFLGYGGNCDNTRSVFALSNRNQYVNITLADAGATNGQCKFNPANLNSIPFFGTKTYADIANNIYSIQINGSLGILFSSVDLGYWPENDTNYLFFNPGNYPTGFTFFYDAYDNVLVPINGSYDEGAYCPSGTLCNHGLSPADPKQLNGLQCRFSSTNFTNNLGGVKNGQDGTYDYLCYNNDGFGPRNTGTGWVVNFTGPNNQALIVYPNTNYNMMFYNYSTYNSITGTTWSPTNPQAAQNVTISFFTALPSDTYVFYHYKNVTGNDTYPLTWISLYNNATVTAHSIVINSANIFDGKIYEFYVQTSTPSVINDTNNTFNYNFVVGAYAGFTNVGASNTIGGAASNLGGTGLCNGSDCLYIVGIVFLIGIGIPAFYYGHTKMAIPIISTAIIVESLVGLLPLYLILPFVIFGLLWLIKKLGIIGGGSSEE